MGRGGLAHRASGLQRRLLALRSPVRRRPGDARQPDPDQPPPGASKDHRGGGRDGLQKTPQVRSTMRKEIRTS